MSKYWEVLWVRISNTQIKIVSMHGHLWDLRRSVGNLGYVPGIIPIYYHWNGYSKSQKCAHFKVPYFWFIKPFHSQNIASQFKKTPQPLPILSFPDSETHSSPLEWCKWEGIARAKILGVYFSQSVSARATAIREYGDQQFLLLLCFSLHFSWS